MSTDTTEATVGSTGAALAATTLHETATTNGAAPSAEVAPTAPTTATTSPDAAGGNGGGAGGEWDDEALAASYARKGAVTGGAASTELLDMKALELKRREEDDVAERMRLEETKAKLAAAREGMEREAQRLKEEREKKDDIKTKKATDATAVSGGGGGLGLGGAKWLPPHLRAGAGLSRVRMGAAMGGAAQKLDTEDENLFPDLASADAILEQQKTQVAYKVTKKTPVGGGATWGSRPAAVAKPKEEPPKKEPSTPEPKKATVDPPPPVPTEAPAPAPAAAAPAASTAPVTPIKKKKKKKKDLSTFKSGA